MQLHGEQVVQCEGVGVHVKGLARLRHQILPMSGLGLEIKIKKIIIKSTPERELLFGDHSNVVRVIMTTLMVCAQH